MVEPYDVEIESLMLLHDITTVMSLCL